MARPTIEKIERLGFRSPRSLARALSISEWELNAIADLCKHSYPYHAWKRPKRSGAGFRLIEHPFPRLKSIQQSINRLLQRVRIPAVFHGSCRHTHIKTNALAHVNGEHFEAFDLADYYFNLPPEKVFQALYNQGCSVPICSLLTRLTTIDRHVPQGAPTSPMIAVLALLSAEARFRKLCENVGAVPTIYGDNICLSGPRRLSRYSGTFQEILLSEGFVVNFAPEKRIRLHAGVPWPLPGVQLWNGKLDVREDDFNDLLATLQKCELLGPTGLQLATCKRYQPKIKGRLCFCKWVGTNDGVLSLRASTLVAEYDRIEWPLVFENPPCAGKSCQCELE